ncbi:thymidine kinase [Ravibacter arvi]|uniref:Thymidine kinase n=1 Tax=Ravibacter arvi TaxID=2051041 RepID=A0ABP8LP38_9BACT
MFIEPLQKTRDKSAPAGWIEVICGSMFSGKTEELIRRLNRALIAKLKVTIFKPSIDTRYHQQHIVSHNDNTIASVAVAAAGDILALAGDCDVVGIDEAQFFEQDIVEVCNTLADRGKRVIVAGLDMDFKGEPFGYIPELLSIAEYVTKVHAICMVCGDVASYSFRLTPTDDQVLLGETSTYEARCRKCFNAGRARK